MIDFAPTSAAEKPPANAHELTLAMFSPAQILVDAKDYQFRKKGDANGVTQTHNIEAEHWDSLLHGTPLIVHERLDGKVFVADGHHRLDFAKKLTAKGEGPKQLAAYVLREADGYSVDDAKIAAAYANMARGSEDPLEAARVFKEAREKNIDALKLPNLNMNLDNLRVAYKLSGFSEGALSAVEEEKIPLKMAELVAERVEPARQENVLRTISAKLKQDYAMPVSQNFPVSYDLTKPPAQENDNVALKPANQTPEGFAARLIKSRELTAALRGL